MIKIDQNLIDSVGKTYDFKGKDFDPLLNSIVSTLHLIGLTTNSSKAIGLFRG